MRILIVPILALATAGAAPVVDDAAGDRAAIKSQAGCYRVQFEFAETFARRPGYEPKPSHKTGGVEWVVVTEDEPGRVVLQHVLAMPGGGMKHWRQVWDLEPRELFAFVGHETWEKRAVSPEAAEGAWAQRVYQVDDGPRYECVAPWIRHGSRSYWECEAWTPLPRREAARASEYDVLVRRNRHELLSGRWVHEQDNVKLSLAGGAETPLVEEKGLNAYVALDPAACATAAAWWATRADAWRPIQAAWDEIFAERSRLRFATDGEPLWAELTTMAEEAALQGAFDPAALRAAAKAAIARRLR